MTHSCTKFNPKNGAKKVRNYIKFISSRKFLHPINNSIPYCFFAISAFIAIEMVVVGLILMRRWHIENQM